MNVLEQFIAAFKARVILKANQGRKARMSEFDAIVADIEMIYGSIPNIAKIRAYFFKCLAKKTNWGCRMVIREFDYSIANFNTAG